MSSRDNPVTPPHSPPPGPASSSQLSAGATHIIQPPSIAISANGRSTPEAGAARIADSPREPVRRRRRRSEPGHPRSRGSVSSGSSSTPVPPTNQQNNNVVAWNATNQLYSNLLILEESLRSQYIKQRLIRRKYTSFYFSLIALIIYLAYYQLFNPSPYRYLYIFFNLALVSATITVGIFHLMGLYTKLIVHPKRFLLYANKGIRTFNVKAVRVPSSWKLSILQLLRHRSYRYRGGDLVKLVLIPRAFSSDIREGWEIYRQEYWGRENHRRELQGGIIRQRSPSIISPTTTTTAPNSMASTTGSSPKRRPHPSPLNGVNGGVDDNRQRRKPSATLRP